MNLLNKKHLIHINLEADNMTSEKKEFSVNSLMQGSLNHLKPHNQ